MSPEAGFPATIPALLAWRAARSPGRPWLFYEGDSWTLADVVERTDRLAVGLAERGVVAGDRVASVLGNTPETLFAWLAANRLGAIAVLIDPASKPPELAALLARIRPRVAIAAGHRALVEAACAGLEAGSRPQLAEPPALACGGVGAQAAEVLPGDVAVLIPTSGTTGAPKLVMQTHRTYTLTAEAFPWWLGLDETDRLLAPLPLFHINAQAYSVMGALGSGAGLALVPRFSASRFWEQVRAVGATEVNAVGAMVHILANQPASPRDRDHRLRLVYCALALPEAAHRAFEERFGVNMVVGYGLSETTFGTVWPRGTAPSYGTMGKLRQHPRLGDINRARVTRDDGSEAPDGEPGELWLDNPATMRGYWEDVAQTDAARDGAWFKTGDLVTRDADGFFTFVARKKELIRRRGENVAPAEIEAVLAAYPDVAEVAVVGVPSELGEEDIVAWVVPRPGAAIDVEALRAWARARLSDHKVPSQVFVRQATELPRTPTQRIAKHVLRRSVQGTGGSS